MKLYLLCLGVQTARMSSDWSRRVLSIIQPLAYAGVIRRFSRSQLVEWAETLEGVAREMRERAGEDRNK